MSKKNIISLLIFALILLLALPVNADYDFGGETITIWDLGMWGDAEWPFKEGEMLEGRVKEAEEKFNVNIKFESQAEKEERVLSGDSKNDIWLDTHYHFMRDVPKDVYYPISDIIDIESHKNEIHRYRANAIDTFKYHGGTYGFGNEYHPPRMRMWKYNLDMIEENGLEDPYEVYKEGEWTWDTFEEYLRTLRQDTNGDGEYDQYAISAADLSGSIDGPQEWQDGWYPPLYFANTNGVGTVEIDENGKVEQNIDSDEYIKAFQQLYEWDIEQKLIGEANFEKGSAAFITTSLAWIKDNSDHDFDWGVVPMPKGPDAEKHHFPVDQLNAWTLPVNSAHPKGKVELIEFLYPTEPYDKWYKEEAEKVAPTKKSYELLLESFNNWPGELPDSDPFYRALDVYTAGQTNDIYEGEISPRAALEEQAPEAQAEIDDLMGY